MSTALFVSPHLDDVAFSCGGTLARLKALGWDVALLTLFTRSMPGPTGFALDCQTDRGLAPDVDDMALRRDEDRVFAALMKVDWLYWGELPEAPHRGYPDAPSLFESPREDDTLHEALETQLSNVLRDVEPDLLFAPQSVGGHVDHVQVTRLLASLEDWAPRTLWYRDLPYALRMPGAWPDVTLPEWLEPLAVDVSAELSRKIAGCNCYRSQLRLQFGGLQAVAPLLDGFHLREAASVGRAGHAELVLAGPDLAPCLRQVLTGEALAP